MEADSHNTISRVECFLNTITVMNVNINIENTIVVSKSKVLATFLQKEGSSDLRSSNIPSTMSTE